MSRPHVPITVLAAVVVLALAVAKVLPDVVRFLHPDHEVPAVVLGGTSSAVVPAVPEGATPIGPLPPGSGTVIRPADEAAEPPPAIPAPAPAPAPPPPSPAPAPPPPAAPPPPPPAAPPPPAPAPPPPADDEVDDDEPDDEVEDD